MWREFIDSWPLFHHAYLAGAGMAVALALTGVVVVARNQIFVGAAVSQASTLGIAALLWLSGLSAAWHERVEEVHGLTHFAGVLASVVAALFAGREARAGREGREALTGWIFLLGASASVLIVSNSPHGLEEVQRLQLSSLIGATPGDVAGFGALAAFAIVFVAVARPRLMLFCVDPVMAASVGLRVGAWSVGLALWLGLVTGFSLYSAGMLFTFGGLVLPALLARALCREFAPVFVLAPLLALAAAFAGFVLANHFDLPPAQMTVALLSLALPVAWLFRRLRG